MDKKPNGSTIEWLIELIGSRHSMSRKDILAAARATNKVRTHTISTYLTTADHLGHVEGNCAGPRWASRRLPGRIPYLRRVSRGTYTLSEIGWRRYREMHTRAILSKSDVIESMAKTLNIPIVTIVCGPLDTEDVCGLPVVSSPEHHDYGLL